MAFSEMRRKGPHALCMAKPKLDPIAKEMAKRVRDQRKARKWTQLELAEATGWTAADDDAGKAKGYSPSRIGNYEQGIRRLGIEEAEVFEDTFGLPSAYFLTVIDEREAQVVAAMRSKHRRTG